MFAILSILLIIPILSFSQPQPSVLENLVILPIDNSFEQELQTQPPLTVLSLQQTPQDSCVILIDLQQNTNLELSDTCTQEQIQAINSLPPTNDFPSQLSLELGQRPTCEENQILIPSFIINVFRDGIVVNPANPVCAETNLQEHKNILYIDNALLVSSELALNIDLQSQRQLENFLLTTRSILLANRNLLEEGSFSQISEYLSQNIQEIQNSIKENSPSQTQIWENLGLIQSSVASIPLAPVVGGASAPSFIARALALIGSSPAITLLSAVLAIGLTGDTPIEQSITTSYPPINIELVSQQLTDAIFADAAFQEWWNKLHQNLRGRAATKELIKGMLESRNTFVDEIWQDQHNWNKDAKILIMKWFPIELTYRGLLGNVDIDIPAKDQERIRLSNIPIVSDFFMSEIDGVFIIIRPPGAIDSQTGDFGLPARSLDQVSLKRLGIPHIKVADENIILGLLGVSSRNQGSIAIRMTQQDRGALIGRWDDITGAGMDSVVYGRINLPVFYESLICVRNPQTVPVRQTLNTNRFRHIRNKIPQGRIIARNLWIPLLSSTYPRDSAGGFRLQECNLGTLAPIR